MSARRVAGSRGEEKQSGVEMVASHVNHHFRHFQNKKIKYFQGCDSKAIFQAFQRVSKLTVPGIPDLITSSGTARVSMRK